MISQDVSRVNDILKEILVLSFISVHKPHFCSFDLHGETAYLRVSLSRTRPFG